MCKKKDCSVINYDAALESIYEIGEMSYLPM